MTILVNYANVSFSTVEHFSKKTITSKTNTQIALTIEIIAPDMMSITKLFSYVSFQSSHGFVVISGSSA